MHEEVRDALEIAKHGALRGDTPGRTDVLDISVPAESFVIPADTVSSIGQGNTGAGMKILEQMFPEVPETRAAGGSVSKVPIVAAAGEFVVHPEHVKRIGGGDFKRGHRELDKFVKSIRAKTIKALRKMAPPAKG